MEFHQTLASMMDARGMTNYRLAQILDVSQSTIANWLNGTSMPRRSTMKSIAETFGVSVEELTGSPSRNPAALSRDELAIMQKIRALDEHGRKMVSMVLEEETRRLREKNDVAEAEKIIPLFGTAAAAGPGEPDTGLPWEDYTVPADSRADFAVRISGDSMEPVLHDGQVALCAKRRPQIGELAVIMVNGALLCKQFITDNYGNVYLRSLNRARKDCDYDLMASGTDTAQSFGVVILPKRIPLVDE